MSEWDGASVSQRDLDDLSGFDGDGFSHVVSWEARGEIESGGVCRFVCWEDGAIIESFDSDGRGADASEAGDFYFGDKIGRGLWLSAGHGR